MTENVTILTATGSLIMAKKWLPNGDAEPYAKAKNFKYRTAPVDSIFALSRLLTEIESNHQTCLIRGGYIGDELAIPLMRSVENWATGCVVRQETVFKDRALQSFLVDVDHFMPSPSHGDPNTNPIPCIDEYIHTHLPECFHGISYHWQLSNSAGLAKNAGVLKVHIWFWLETGYTGHELTAWRNHADLKAVDTSVFRQAQPLYTAAPKMSEGVVDPIPVRSGFVDGLFGDSVPLVIPVSVLASMATSVDAKDLQEELRNAVSNDAVAQRLYDKGMVRGVLPRGALNVVCPRESEHTDGKTGPTSCAYFPAFTNGYRQGNFKCLHASCAGAPLHMFTEALGFSVLDGIEDVPVAGYAGTLDAPCDDLFSDGETSVKTPAAKKTRLAVPEARHLCTDQANVQRLLKHFGKRLLVASDRWYAWDGSRWVPDETIATRYAMTLSKIISQEASEWEKKPAVTGEEEALNKDIAKALKSWSTKAEMRSTIDAALALAKRVLTIEDDKLDSDPWLLNCENGTVDTRTGKMKPHDQTDYLTKICPVPYDPTASCPTFDSVLLRVCCEEGGPAPVAKFLQRWFGYCATASTREQKFVVHYGLGSNGKSTVLDIISEVMGDYAGTAAPGLLVAGGKDRHPTEIADLFGRRMVTAHESSEGGVLREDFVKQATGGDRIKARFMRADFFEFAPTHKIQLLTNHKPTIKGQDHGIWRRVVMVPYKARFGTPEEVAIGSAMYVKDLNVLDRLRHEKQGVLRWLVAGAVEWYRDGLNPPDYVLAASGEYQKEQDRVLHFLQENCDLDPSYSVFLTSEMGEGVFQVYESWCKEGGFFALSKIRFLQEIERLVPGFQKKINKVRTLGGRRREVLQLFGIKLME